MQWIVVALIGYCLVYVSLYLGCRIFRVSGANAGRLATASLVILLVYAALCWWLVSSHFSIDSPAGAALILVPAYAAVFLLMFVVAPWFLRPTDGSSWGLAWGASAISGIALCVLITLTYSVACTVLGPIATKSRIAKTTAKRTSVLTAYGLPCPANAKFSDVLFGTPQERKEAIDRARSNPNYKRMFDAWFERWPYNDYITFEFSESPSTLADFLATRLEQAGFAVRRSGSECVTGAKSSLFVAYQITELGGRLWCSVRVWKDFAKEMEAVCAAEMKAN